MFSPARIAVIACSVLISVSGANAQCARNYTVVSGDFCDEISAAQHSSTFQLANANPNINADCTNLFAGEVICLGLLGRDCTTTTVIQPGDGCDTITAAAGIPLSTLLHNNPNVNADCTNIGIGEVLCTSGGLFNYTV
ncbi:hypothetical protein K435DRAFT_784490 [Dendrothele bispora CBS 962.96]|uniref:LysM domain-containing protein n=1 Tax=Dendrothele bispora (strain CBS 962.96) TaxID=1314807 RepID=A0A4S8L2T8_DENBC|nr:hypothetical protein K435DRAFT_784490 [Dendrothele bispora CBS 962.96]